MDRDQYLKAVADLHQQWITTARPPTPNPHHQNQTQYSEHPEPLDSPDAPTLWDAIAQLTHQWKNQQP